MFHFNELTKLNCLLLWWHLKLVLSRLLICTDVKPVSCWTWLSMIQWSIITLKAFFSFKVYVLSLNKKKKKAILIVSATSPFNLLLKLLFVAVNLLTLQGAVSPQKRILPLVCLCVCEKCVNFWWKLHVTNNGWKSKIIKNNLKYINICI